MYPPVKPSPQLTWCTHPSPSDTFYCPFVTSRPSFPSPPFPFPGTDLRFATIGHLHFLEFYMSKNIQYMLSICNQHNYFEIHAHFCIYLYIYIYIYISIKSPFYYWVIFNFMDTSQFACWTFRTFRLFSFGSYYRLKLLWTFSVPTRVCVCVCVCV